MNATLDSENAQSGRLTLHERPFDACRLIRSLVLLARPEAAAKGSGFLAHVERELETEPGAPVADPERVRQIAAGLIGNAVKYTVRGRVEVRVQRAGPRRLRIEVADTGPGLSSDELVQAFQPFRRVERTSAGLSGAGLGLSLARDMARRLWGASGRPQRRGDRQPLLAGAAVRSDRPTRTRSGQPRIRRRTGNAARSLRVLVAGGDTLNTAMLRAVLEQLGHQVVHSIDGGRALDMLQVCDFDILMIDGLMTGPDAATIQTLRAWSGPAANTPIVAVLGGEGADAQACLQACDAVLRKPVSVSGLARILASAFSQRRPVLPAESAGASWRV